jgi:dethiobiotin synthetase
MRGWFITGTDTGVGKTFTAQVLLAALRQRGLRAVGMKSVASGCQRTPQGLRSDDALALLAEGAVAADYRDVNPYAFEPAVAPHLAAGTEPIRPERIRTHFENLQRLAPWTVVEGIGGWLVPISPDQTMADVARVLQLPVILVVGLRLGCLNHALLTAQAIERSGLPLAGWIANSLDPAMALREENIRALQTRLPAPLLAQFPHLPSGIAPGSLASSLALDKLINITA